jgi:uncharacterized protein (TIGR02302 family)
MNGDLNRKVDLQRAALFWEGLWQAVQKPLLVVGSAIILIASDILGELPKYAQLATLLIMSLAFLYSLRDLLKLKLPQRLKAMRRLELASNLDHRSVSSHQDELVAENQSAATTELWEEHQRRKLALLENLKISKPKSAWRLFDPMALRVPVGLGVLAALLLGPGDLISNAINAANLTTPSAQVPLTLDAWLRPPSYTGKPPVLLTSAAMREKLASGGDILVPENALLSMRVEGATKSRLAFYPLGATAKPETELKSITAKSSTSETGFSSEVKLDRPTLVKLFDGDTELASWPIALIPDEPPKIKITDQPKAEKLGATSLSWEAADDYGVKSITAEISLADQQEDSVGFENNGVFLFDPPVFKISLRHSNAKTEAGTTTQDMAAHPWAGLYVQIALTATDGAGHTTTTEAVRYKMPERNFYKLLAAAIIEQRKSLILNPDAAPDVATMLDAILAYPFSVREQAGLILNLAFIKSSLANAGDTEEVGTAISKLWPLAIAIEDGELADARAELKALKQQLEQALRDGAPPEKIAELTDKMRKAMDRLLDQMRKEAEKRNADGSAKKDKQQGREISKEELQKMLDDIKKLSESGSKEAAEKLLSELDKLLQNLQPGTGDQADQNGDPGLQEKMDELSNMMRRQQELMDKTQRLPQNGGEQPGDQPGANGKPGEGSNLADRQSKLSDQLDRLNRELDGETKDNFGEASKNMKDAAGKLREGSKDDALQQQGEAMRQLQEGAKKLGKKLAEKGQGKAGQKGKDGEAGSSDDDPLGRPKATNNPDQGPYKNTVPSEMAQRRAREILEQLRNRSNEQNLDETEKSYIQRLLRGLY